MTASEKRALTQRNGHSFLEHVSSTLRWYSALW